MQRPTGWKPCRWVVGYVLLVAKAFDSQVEPEHFASAAILYSSFHFLVHYPFITPI